MLVHKVLGRDHELSQLGEHRPVQVKTTGEGGLLKLPTGDNALTLLKVVQDLLLLRSGIAGVKVPLNCLE